MRKYLLLAIIILQITLLFGQTHPLYNQQGVSLDYSQTKYNTVEYNGEIYDQYEVIIVFRNNNSTSYIHEPRVCRVSFSSDVKHPSSHAEFDFVQNGEAHGYVEYKDGTPLPENLNSPKEEDKYGSVVSRMIIKPFQEDECTKYILLKSGTEFPEPNWSLEFDNQIPVLVNGSISLVKTWVERQATGISLNNVSSWPMIIRKPFDGTNCGEAKPIGNRGDESNKKISVGDLRASLTKDIDERKKIFKQFFIQNGFQYQSEGNQTLRICVDDLPENSISGLSLVFNGFKICFTNNGETVFYTNINENKEIGEKAYQLIESENDSGIGGCEYGSALYLK